MMLSVLLAVVTSTIPDGCDVCAQDKAEYCELFPSAKLCDTKCGFEFDGKQCNSVLEQPTIARSNGDAAPIIGGSGKFRYQYMPELLQAPAGATFVNCHGLAIDKVKELAQDFFSLLSPPFFSFLNDLAGCQSVACKAHAPTARVAPAMSVSRFSLANR